MAKRVTTIQPTLTRFTAEPITEKRKRRVAAYARVSTDKDEQFTSYEAQIDYYTTFINARDDWELINVYTDEGITGTSTKHREGFKQMVADALDGKIDLIVTKSVSRFARNTVDSLTTIRQLKDKGVEVFFEKENIWTFDGKGELLITIMSSIAQEESRSISENCTWGQRKRFADGKVSVPFGRFLGYDRGPDGEMIVNREQAEIVKRIYALFLQGQTPYAIAKILTRDKVPTPGGKKVWNKSCVQSILTNEKYKGDAILQKVFTEDFLTKKKVKNIGQVPQYYVAEDHEAIISPEVFEMVQSMMASHIKKGVNRYGGRSVFSSLLFCGECGGTYGRKIWHSTDKYRAIVWVCNRKYDNGKKCTTPRVKDEELRQLFVKALNMLLGDRRAISKTLKEAIATAYGTEALQAEREKIIAEMAVVAEMVMQYVQDNASKLSNQSDYDERYAEVTKRYTDLKQQDEDLQNQISDKASRQAAAEEFLKEFIRQPDTVLDFDPTTLRLLTERITVYPDGKIIFRFKDGTEIEP